MRHDAAASIAALANSKFAFHNAAVANIPAVPFFDCIVLCAFFPGCSRTGPFNRMPWAPHQELYSCKMESASLLAGMSDFWQERPFKGVRGARKKRNAAGEYTPAALFCAVS